MKEFAKTLPVLPAVYRGLRNRYRALRGAHAHQQLKMKNPEQIFTEIYQRNAWGGKESVSGPGSDVFQARVIIRELPSLLHDLKVSSMLDIPCGDFHWMQEVDLTSIDYIGADIVDELIQDNRKRYAKDGVSFQHLNLMKDKLPKVDLVFCRDCFIHLSFADVFLALDNVGTSQPEYFITTTFPGRKENHDIVTGKERVLNLELAPFMFPKPLRTIDEGCTESGGAFADKALGLWRMADIRESRTRHPPDRDSAALPGGKRA